METIQINSNEAEKKTVVVGLGELVVSEDPTNVLACLGLGSCVGVCAYDPISKIGGMAYIVLPSSKGRHMESSAIYADTAIPMLFREMEKLGADKVRIKIKLVGGAEILVNPGLKKPLKIGEKIQEVIRAKLTEEGTMWMAADIGGNYGRSSRLFINTGKVVINVAGKGEKEL